MNVPDTPQPDSWTSPSAVIDEETNTTASGRWQVIVWDDPVNLMSYVEYVFMKYFGFSRERAHERMLTVHNEGKAVVATGSKERAEADVQAMHGYGLHATMRPEVSG